LARSFRVGLIWLVGWLVGW